MEPERSIRRMAWLANQERLRQLAIREGLVVAGERRTQAAAIFFADLCTLLAAYGQNAGLCLGDLTDGELGRFLQVLEAAANAVWIERNERAVRHMMTEGVQP